MEKVKIYDCVLHNSNTECKNGDKNQ
jgi:hypothetical protein